MRESWKKILGCCVITILVFVISDFIMVKNEKNMVYAAEYNDYTYEETTEGTICITNIAFSEDSDELVIPSFIAGKKVTQIDREGLCDIFQYYKRVTLPATLENLDWASGYLYDNDVTYELESINVSDSEIYSSEDGILYSKDKRNLILCPPAYKRTEIIIPETVKVIGRRAFYSHILEKVTLPDGLTKISDHAFFLCDQIKTVKIPDTVEEIGARAFGACMKLQKIDIPKGVRLIGEFIFSGCNNLRFVRISESVQGTYYNEENEDYQFSSIFSYDEAVNSRLKIYCKQYSPIYNYAQSCNIPTVDYDDYETDVTKAENGGIFEYIKLPDDTIEITGYIGLISNVMIPGQIDGYNVKGIGNRAFYNDNSIIQVTVPKGITYIGERAFADCAYLQKVNLPDGLISIGDYAFDFCIDLIDIQIPDTVKSIGEAAFLECYDLPEITVPEGITKLERAVFCCCYQLTDVKLPTSLKVIGSQAFDGCYRLININIPDGVTTIEENAFNFAFFNETPVNLEIPKSVTSIGKKAFFDCRKLSSIVIKNPNCSIYDDESTIYSGATISGYANSTALTYAQKYGRKFVTLKESVLTPEAPATISSSKKSLNNLPAIGIILQDAAMKNNYVVTAPGQTVAYKGTINKKAKSITVPATVTIEGTAYKVTSIAAGAFKNNKNITKVTISSNISSIGKQAFYGCKKLKTINIKSKNLTARSIGAKAFSKVGSNNYKKLTVKVPKSKKNTYKKILKKKGLSGRAKVK